MRQFAESWPTELRHAPGTAANLEAALRIHVYPVLGDFPVDDVPMRDAMRLERSLELADLAAATRGRLDTRVRSLFTAASGEGWTESSPFDHVPRIRVSKRESLRQGEYVPSMGEALFLADKAAEDAGPTCGGSSVPRPEPACPAG